MQPENLRTLCQLLEKQTFPSRWSVTAAVCSAFNFLDSKGRPRRQSCLAALTAMERRGVVCLPEAGAPVANFTPKVLTPVAPARGVPDRVDKITDLRVALVASTAERLDWRSMMACEHPLGRVRAAGCQLRYFIRSERHGLLGGFLFAASTPKQQARDAWIDWHPQMRDARLHLVVGMARFLIRPAVRCLNLASRSLALVRKRVVQDYAAEYGTVPVLLESYVSPAHDGASYRAAGWVRVGESSGRDRRRRRVPAKAIYLLPLQTDWRQRLGSGPLPINAFEGLDGDHWAQHEFGRAPLGDVRRVARLVTSAAQIARAPSKSFLTAARGNQAMTTGFYRLIEHPDEDAINSRTILAAHRQRVRERIQGQETVLLIQDGSDLNYSTHRACTDMGKVARTRNSEGTRGLHAHSTYVVTQGGLPLGVAAIAFDRSAIATTAEEKARRQKKKPDRWIRGLRDSADLVHGLTAVRSVAVMDREGDDFAILHAHRHLESDLHILVRVRQDRRLGRQTLFASLQQRPSQASMMVTVPRLSARAAGKGQKEKPGRIAREAPCNLRWRSLTLPVPQGREAEFGETPLPLWVVHLEEETAPDDGSDRLEWVLYTSLPIDTPVAATEVIDLYRRRWKIEEWHRIWKTGCQAESLAHVTCLRQERALAIRAVVAWRLAALTTLGRETPGLAPSVVFSRAEMAVINDFATDRKSPRPTTLGATVNVLAQMGGYLDRRQDPAPGVQVFWEGYSYLAGMAEVLERARRLGQKADAVQYLKPE